MHSDLEFVLFLIGAAIVALIATLSVNEWLRARQFKENLKPNGRRK